MGRIGVSPLGVIPDPLLPPASCDGKECWPRPQSGLVKAPWIAMAALARGPGIGTAERIDPIAPKVPIALGS